jgi:hypothetical protein
VQPAVAAPRRCNAHVWPLSPTHSPQPSPAVRTQPITLARDFSTNRSSINDLTRDVLGWWRRHGSELGPEWCKGARIVFSLMPNSAASERVFSLLACLFPSTRASTLADQLELTLMLRFNKRVA